MGKCNKSKFEVMENKLGRSKDNGEEQEGMGKIIYK